MAVSSRTSHVLVSGMAFLLSFLCLALHPDVILASRVLASSSSSVDCTIEETACTNDEDCYACQTALSNENSSDYDECLPDLDEASEVDACSVLWYTVCCIDALSKAGCMDNEKLLAFWACIIESTTDCSADDLSCVDSAIEDSSGKTDDDGSVVEDSSRTVEDNSGAVGSASILPSVIVYIATLPIALVVVALSATT